MASISMLTQSKLGKIDDIELDATLTETHVGENQITEHPVERGADITDHIRSKPDVVTLDCMATNTPMGSVFAIPANFTFNPERAQEVYRKILDIKESGRTVTIVTSLKQYFDMAIKSITVNRDKDTANAVMMKIVLQRITLATSKSVDQPKNPKKKSDGPKKSPAKKPPAPTDNRTGAAQAADWGVKTFKSVFR